MKNKSFHDWRRVLTLALFVLLGSAYTWAQSIQVTGKVIDNLGEPMIGVSVLEKGTTNGIVTDLDGNYSLNVPQGATLVFSYIGYMTQEQTVTSGTLNITMKEDNELLDEVVVIGYGTVKAKNFTGSVDMVKMSDSPIADLSLTSAADLLRGRLSGVIMGAESGEVGTSSSILIRGQKSIKSTSEEPLIILNGVIFTGELNDIDPTTIENISVLKDATSLAAYGSKAAQGVIMVTTKKGKEGKPQISFSTSHQFSTPSYKPKYLSGEQYIVYKNMKNGNVDDLTNTSWMTPFELENYEKGQETDWYDLATRMGYTQNYNASISGAGERFNYYVSVGHSDMKGMLLGNHFARNTMSMNTSSKVASWLELGANMSFTNTINDEVPVGLYGCLLTPYGEPYLPDGSYRKFVDGQDAVMTSPLWTTGAERNNRRSNLNLGGFLSLDIPWVEGLNFRVNASYSRVDLNNKSFYHESYYPTNIAGDWDGIGYTGSNLSLVEANGTIASTQTISWLMDYILSYSRAFGNHYVSASLVYTRDSSEAIAQSYTGKDFTNAGNTLKGWYGIGDAGAQTITNPTYSLHNDVGYLGRVMWSYKDTYHLNASLRRDGSSVFGADHKWGYFPAFGAAWTITNEGFMEPAKKWLDNLKLKLSWGKNGAQTLAPYGTLSTISLAQGGGIANYYDGTIHWGQTISTLGNPELGWQTTTSWNAGFESDLFNRRLHFELNFYKSKTTDQIFERNIPVMGAGVTTQKATMGQVNNWGIEVNASSVNIKNNDFSWTTDLIFTLNRNKLVDLYGDGQDDLTNGYFIGKSLGAIYGYEVSRIDSETGTPLYIAADGTETANPSPEDRKILGYQKENFRINLSNTFKYKDWQLYFMLTGIFGGNGYGLGNNTFAYVTYNTGHSYSGYDIPFWTPENKSSEYPSPAFTNTGSYYQVYNSYGHVRLQDLSLSYNITPLVSKWGIKNAKVSLSGRNLFVIAPHWKMSDPEVRSAQTIAMPRAFTVALNLSF